MIIDHRTYTLHPLKLPKWLKLYEEHGLPVQQKHLGKLIGFFTSEIGPLNQVVHLWQFEDLTDRQQRSRPRSRRCDEGSPSGEPSRYTSVAHWPGP